MHICLLGGMSNARLKQPEAAAGTIRRIQFIDAKLSAMCITGNIDQQVSEDTVDHPKRYVTRFRYLLESNLKFI